MHIHNKNVWWICWAKPAKSKVAHLKNISNYLYEEFLAISQAEFLIHE